MENGKYKRDLIIHLLKRVFPPLCNENMLFQHLEYALIERFDVII